MLKRHINEIKVGGWTVTKGKLIKLFSIIPALLWPLPFVIVIRLIRPWKVIRLGTFNAKRIGHFVADAGHQYAMRQLQPKKYIDLYYLNKPTCNTFWEEMVRRNFPVYNIFKGIDLVNRKLPGGSIHHRPSNSAAKTQSSRDTNGLLEKAGKMMQFTAEEDKMAKSWLQKQGWQEGEKFACLLVRDNAYLDNSGIHKKKVSLDGVNCERRWSYHDYRDSDIQTYVPAAEWLAEQGIWVFRMGKIMKNPMPCSHTKVIDYAFHPNRSDFLDIWLFAHCDLCISTGSGPDAVSDIYRRPLLILNFLPLQLLWSWSNAGHIPKHLFWSDTGKPLTWSEHLEHNYLFAEKYKSAGIVYEDLNVDEILQAVQERWARIQGTWVDSAEDIRRHQRSWEILKNHKSFNEWHGWIHPEARIGTTWLRLAGDDFLS